MEVSLDLAPAKGSPQSWISQGMGSGALALFRLTWMLGRPQWGALTSAARQGTDCTSSPQEKLSKDVCEFIEDHIQENLPVSWSHCLSTFLPSLLVSLVLGAVCVHRAAQSQG